MSWSSSDRNDPVTKTFLSVDLRCGQQSAMKQARGSFFSGYFLLASTWSLVTGRFYGGPPPEDRASEHVDYHAAPRGRGELRGPYGTGWGEAVESLESGRPGVIDLQTQFGGQIFGFDIDQASNEGILCEARTLDNNRIHAAIETFNQTTGAIIKVIRETQTRDDFVTLGVVGTSVGLVEREHSTGGLNVIRTFSTLDPLRRNRFTGEWTPPLGTDHLVTQVSRTQGTPNVAVYALDLSSHFRPTLFTSDVGANTFGPVVSIRTRILSTEVIRRWPTTAR